jgi:PAS domain S-box-containing protein
LAGAVVEADATGVPPISYISYIAKRDPGTPVIALIRESVPPRLDLADPLVPIVPVPISDRGTDLLRRALVLAEGRATLLGRLGEVEEAVARRAERFRALTLATRVAVWDWDLSESRVWRSEGFEVLFGYSPLEIDESFAWWAERIHPDDRERVIQRVAPSVAGDDDQIHNSYRFRARDGSYVRVLDSGVVFRSDNNRPIRMIGTVREAHDLPSGNGGERAVRTSAQSSAAEAAMERLSAIEQVTDATLAKLTLEDLLTELLGRLRAGLGADAALAHLLTEDGTTLMRRAWIGVGGVAPRAVEIPVGAGYSGRIAESGNPMMVADIWAGPIVPVGRLAEFTSLLGTPLILEGKTIGVLSVLTRKRREFTHSDQSLLQIVADRVAFVVDRANLADRLRTEHRELETLSRRLVKLQEEERHEIARELHDSAGQILTALKLALESKRLDRNHIDSLLGELHDQLGDISMNLRPPMLDDLGLLPALRWHLKRFSSDTGVHTRLHSKGVDARFRTELELASFRIVQEALTNVVRHARTGSAIVDVLCAEGVLHVRVTDAGSGFDPEAVPPGGGSGLIGMRERATLLGGIFSIQSSPGKGTSVIAELPVA